MSGELETLYPFLNDRQHDPVALDSVLLHSVGEKARDSRETNARFFTGAATAKGAAA
jgi:D-sedoheptulose 7-phosphate isomerase